MYRLMSCSLAKYRSCFDQHVNWQILLQRRTAYVPCCAVVGRVDLLLSFAYLAWRRGHRHWRQVILAPGMRSSACCNEVRQVRMSCWIPMCAWWQETLPPGGLVCVSRMTKSVDCVGCKRYVKMSVARASMDHGVLPNGRRCRRVLCGKHTARLHSPVFRRSCTSSLYSSLCVRIRKTSNGPPQARKPPIATLCVTT